MTSWKPIRCPHCEQLHEQPGAQETVADCATILAKQGKNELKHQRFIPIQLQMYNELKAYPLHIENKGLRLL